MPSNFKEKIVEGLNGMVKCGWRIVCTHDIECQGRKYKGKEVTAVFIENCIVSVFFEDDYEYQCNSDAFIDYLLRGQMLSVEDFCKNEIYPNY